MTKSLENFLKKQDIYWYKYDGDFVTVATGLFIFKIPQIFPGVHELGVWYKNEGGSVQYADGAIFDRYMSQRVDELFYLERTGATLEIGSEKQPVAVFLWEDENVLVSTKLLKFANDQVNYKRAAVTDARFSPVYLIDDDFTVCGLIMPVNANVASYKVVKQRCLEQIC